MSLKWYVCRDTRAHGHPGERDSAHAQRNVRRIPLVEGERFVGIVTFGDLLLDEADDLIAQLPSLLQPTVMRCRLAADKLVTRAIIERELVRRLDVEPSRPGRFSLPSALRSHKASTPAGGRCAGPASGGVARCVFALALIASFVTFALAGRNPCGGGAVTGQARRACARAEAPAAHTAKCRRSCSSPPRSTCRHAATASLRACLRACAR